MVLSPNVPLHLKATAPFTPLLLSGEERRTEKIQAERTLVSTRQSCSSYLGERLRWLEVPIPRIWAVYMDQVVGCHVEIVISE